MSQHRNNQAGGTHTLIIVLLLIAALLGALGYVFMQSYKQQAQTTSTEKASDATAYSYIDYREAKKDVSGKKLISVSDIDTLAISNKLKNYFKSEIGKEIEAMGGETIKQTFLIDRVYGDYAVGPSISAYVVYGPKDGTGEIDIVAGTQNIAMSCKDLGAAKVPQELVDGECLADDGSGVTSYAN